MNIKKLPIFLFIGLITGSCIKTGVVTTMIKESKDLFKRELTNHFPVEFNGRNARLLISEPTIYTDIQYGCRIHLLLTNASKEIERFENLTSSYKGIYNPDDSCLLIIRRFGLNYKEKYQSYSDSLLTVCNRLSLPIPNFEYLNQSFNIVSYLLPDDFTLYVIDAEPGVFIDTTCLSQGLGLPEYWKNGFSKGIAVSKKREAIVYWLDVW